VSTYSYELEALKAAEPESEYLTKNQLEKKIREKRKYSDQQVYHDHRDDRDDRCDGQQEGADASQNV
jgi:hypothetical protein